MIFASIGGSEHARNDAARFRVCSCPSYGGGLTRKKLISDIFIYSGNAHFLQRLQRLIGKGKFRGAVFQIIERSHHDKSSPVPTPPQDPSD